MGLYENHGLAMLDNLVFLSNSIPKSGSSLLFNLQRDFLLSLSGQEACDYSPLEQAGIQVQGSGFLPTKVLPDFIKLMNSGEIKQKGPLILKIHAPISKQLRAWYEANSCCFISTIVRDPLDILISAMENYRLRGEFKNFETVESACCVVNNYFQSIYDTSVAVTNKSIPIVRYQTLMEDPEKAVLDSFHPQLLLRVLRIVLRSHLDIGFTSTKASHRLQKGGLKRDICELPVGKRDFALHSLNDFRIKLGYGMEGA